MSWRQSNTKDREFSFFATSQPLSKLNEVWVLFEIKGVFGTRLRILKNLKDTECTNRHPDRDEVYEAFMRKQLCQTVWTQELCSICSAIVFECDLCQQGIAAQVYRLGTVLHQLCRYMRVVHLISRGGVGGAGRNVTSLKSKFYDYSMFISSKTHEIKTSKIVMQ